MSENLLKKSRVYLSGPMDFVGSRIIEKYLGWRAIVTPILKILGITVLDPWNKPNIRGHQSYGREGVEHSSVDYSKDFWVNDATRAQFESDFWPTVHIDLRMTDISDFVIAFVPTNIYSVGTVHEIVMARAQHKPVMMISPPVKYDFFPEIAALSPEAKSHLKFYGLKENPQGIPSQWYGNIVGGNNMFDGFGWENIPFKDTNFYPSLLANVIASSKPADEKSDLYLQWLKVKEWIEDHKPLQQLTGGVLDYVEFTEKSEEQLLEDALKQEKEQERQYFWYNQSYIPKRSFLFQLFSIASGFIPNRTNLMPRMKENGEMAYEVYETPDDNWLLINE